MKILAKSEFYYNETRVAAGCILSDVPPDHAKRIINARVGEIIEDTEGAEDTENTEGAEVSSDTVNGEIVNDTEDNPTTKAVRKDDRNTGNSKSSVKN